MHINTNIFNAHTSIKPHVSKNKTLGSDSMYSSSVPGGNS